MRRKQQSRRSPATVVLAAASVLGSCLASALTAPAFAAHAAGAHAAGAHAAGAHAAKGRPRVMVVGQPVGIAADPTTHTFWVAEHDAGKPADSVDKIAEAGHAIVNLRVTSGVNAIAADPISGLVWTIGNSSNGSTHTVTYIKESNDSIHRVAVPASSALTGLAVDPTA